MAIYRSGNPALRETTFAALPSVHEADEGMTLQGTVNKTAVLLLTVFATSMFTWTRFTASGDFGAVSIFLLGGAFGGFAVGLVIILKKTLAPYLSIVYAALEGLFLGGISAIFEAEYPGIAFQALMLTVGICASLLLLYTTRLIRPSENFKLIVGSATLGVALFYLVSIALSFFGVRAPLIHDNSWLGIGFTAAVVVLASLNLVVDFDFIEKGAEQHAPKYMEWYGGFGLLVTLIWLYIELLRLLSKLRSRD